MRQQLIAYYKAWSEFCSVNGIKEWWIAHGNLLSWTWNSGVFPWGNLWKSFLFLELDNDVQISLWTLQKLWTLNSTLYKNQYLLDVNPYSKFRTYKDRRNVIDARFIDTHSGKYIDITALNFYINGSQENYKKILACKSPHWYDYDDIFPLRSTVLHGVPVWRPNRPLNILVKEYTEKSLSNHRWKFFPEKELLGQWIETWTSSSSFEG